MNVSLSQLHSFGSKVVTVLAGSLLAGALHLRESWSSYSLGAANLVAWLESITRKLSLRLQLGEQTDAHLNGFPGLVRQFLPCFNMLLGQICVFSEANWCEIAWGSRGSILICWTRARRWSLRWLKKSSPMCHRSLVALIRNQMQRFHAVAMIPGIH